MSSHFFLFLFVGFFAQAVKGSVGMAFGLICSAFLLTLGLPPMVVSATVHTAGIATTVTSGISHAIFKNIDYTLFRRLVIPGVIGGIVGAYLLTSIPSKLARPILAIYLLIMGTLILYRGLRQILLIKSLPPFFVKQILKNQLPSEHVYGTTPLSAAGGFFDAVGGGGWGHIIISTLLAQAATPHYVIGTVNSAQFFVTFAVSVTFFLTIGISQWPIIIALIIGGVIAAPLSAFMVRRIHPNLLMLMAGILVVLLSSSTIYTFFYTVSHLQATLH